MSNKNEQKKQHPENRQGGKTTRSSMPSGVNTTTPKTVPKSGK